MVTFQLEERIRDRSGQARIGLAGFGVAEAHELELALPQHIAKHRICRLPAAGVCAFERRTEDQLVPDRGPLERDVENRVALGAPKLLRPAEANVRGDGSFN